MIFHGHAENDKALCHCLTETETLHCLFSHTQNMFHVRDCKKKKIHLFRGNCLYSPKTKDGWAY